MSIENTTLKAIADAVANVKAAKSALERAEDVLMATRIAAAESADINDFATCWVLYNALNYGDSQRILKNRIGKHLHPFTVRGKLFAIKERHNPPIAFIASSMVYGISENGITARVNFAQATKGFEENTVNKYGNPSKALAELPIERTKSDFEWSAKERAWVLRAGLEVSHV